MNRIENLLRPGRRNILSIYFTAGYPSIDSTGILIRDLAGAGADMLEIGIPFSDPLADGPVIQTSNSKALQNGMNLNLLFSQLEKIRLDVDIPLLLMGYLNPVLRFGIENFCRRCSETGIDGVIIPDLPPELYLEEYSKLFDENNLLNIFLVAPQTSDERVKYIDSISKGFIYLVSSSATTGINISFSESQIKYFERISSLNLKNAVLTGFGISGNSSFRQACEMSAGAIIGSSFIRMLGEKGQTKEGIHQFIREIREGKQIPADL